MKVSWLVFKKHEDLRGGLVAAQVGMEIPFEIARVYCIYDVARGVKRGRHAHKKLQQVLLCISGSCKILLDNGEEKVTVELNDPGKGIFVDRLIWHEMYDFEPDTVLLAIASRIYDETDYLRDYSSFMDYLKK